LTKDGQAICVDAYCLRLASLPATQVILHMDRDENGRIDETLIDWLEPFNELQPLNDPEHDEKDYREILNRFASYHINDISNFRANHKMDQIDKKQKVNILPDKMDWIPERLRGGWMLKDDYTFRLVYDHRDEALAALQRDFNSEYSFKQHLDLW